MEYKFENLQIVFDGSQEQADEIRKRATTLGYVVNGYFSLTDKCMLTYDVGTANFAFGDEWYMCDDKISYKEFMAQTEKFINFTPKSLFNIDEKGFWHDLTDLSLMFGDLDEKVKVESVNDVVKVVVDKSGNDNDLIISDDNVTVNDLRQNYYKYLSNQLT